jgi:hypothetical protein
MTSGEAHVLPSYSSRDKWERNGADRIGNVWTKKGRIFCSASIPSDAYFSIPSSLIDGTFVQMVWRVNSLPHGKGEMDSIRLDYELSDLDEDARGYSGDPLATVEPMN